ncbi:hypothetical protein EU537_11795 [Candidatus Thorarchaeota archaeon]|nr:MAG: hypothetical protein EU537_11795 [Candidatus Thorarchaeota archaeon]
MQTTEAALEDESPAEPRRFLGSLLILGFLQVLRGVFNWLLYSRNYRLGPLAPPGIDAGAVINPTFLILAFTDIVLIVMVLLLSKHRIAFFVLFFLDIPLVLEMFWFRIAVFRPYDRLSLWYGIGVSILSLFHLAVLLRLDIVQTKES